MCTWRYVTIRKHGKSGNQQKSVSISKGLAVPSGFTQGQAPDEEAQASHSRGEQREQAPAVLSDTMQLQLWAVMGSACLSMQEVLESSGDLFPQGVVGLWKIIFLLFLIASNIKAFYNKHLLLSNKKNH